MWNGDPSFKKRPKTAKDSEIGKFVTHMSWRRGTQHVLGVTREVKAAAGTQHDDLEHKPLLGFKGGVPRGCCMINSNQRAAFW